MVSVIIPNYNHSSYLGQRIESVLNQTYQDFEIIILDDCSTDDSLHVINQYRNHPKVAQVIVNEKNTGSPFLQWEKGITLAQGEYIWIAESDDYSHPTMLASLVEMLGEYPNAAVAFCNSKIVDDNENITMELDFDDINYPDTSIHKGEDFLSYKMKFYTRIYNASSAVFRRTCWERIPKVYTKYRSAGDYLFWVEIMRKGDVCWLHKKLNYYRSHPNNVTKQATSNGRNAEERYKQVCYFRENSYFSSVDMIQIVGQEVFSIKNLPITKRKELYLSWFKSFPLIPFYAICYVVYKIIRKALYKMNIIDRYPKVPLL